ncbi:MULTISPECIES: SfnB family sulfur acquisition oxidoreductase [Pandoraea]|uniref:SfnB family sulfur acquisition oxidoreductase n=1 Tax=Pandoraea TaxID=93217 RepID=UPI001F5C2286|nr:MULTISPECIES: SfnB family sulfur acquisition oxidoreductase [Pandoraea]MCI3205907.1 SfnB family sulfur acquisition oxidoreductase [Pandoraea sp. LA3]MDN4583935.1 SfnB family sulfur acquisition oxidoreductase [Pandoraea capi]
MPPLNTLNAPGDASTASPATPSTPDTSTVATASHPRVFTRLPLPPTLPHRITSEAEALAIARTLADAFRAGAAERDSERRLPWDEIEQFTASGLWAITIPRRHGGLEASYETLAQLFVTICAADPSLGQIPQNHFAVVQNLSDMGSEAQQRRWFADVLAGHRLGNAGPERKSKAAQLYSPTAHLTRDADGTLRVSGTRYYSTGSAFAHWIPFRAVDDAGRAVQVWARRDAPGVSIIDDWEAFGQRTTASGGVIFERVAIGEDDVVPVWRFETIPTLSGPVSQLIQAAIDAGIAQGALADALDFVRDKSRPWVDAGVARASDDPYIIHEIGQLQIEVDAAHAVLLETARYLDELAAHPIDEAISARASVAVAEAKILTTEAALNASEHLFALAGSSASRARYNLDRHWRNARVHTLHDPVRWKYHLIGNYVLNDLPPRRHQWN